MLLQDQAVTWDLRFSLRDAWPWIVCLVLAATVIGLALLRKWRSKQKFVASSDSSK